MTTTTVRITYAVTIPSDWDLNRFAEESAPAVADTLARELHNVGEGGDRYVETGEQDLSTVTAEWVHTRQRVPASMYEPQPLPKSS